MSIHSRRRTVTLLTVGSALSFGMLTAAFIVPATPEWLPSTLGLVGFSAGPILAMFALRAWADLKRINDLRRGVGALGHWQVDLARWREFLVRHEALNSAQTTPAVALPLHDPAADFTVIVGHNQIVIGDEIWPITTPCRVQAFGAALEFEQSWVPSERLIMKEFRVPFGRGADDEVARVVAYFSTPGPPARRVNRVRILLVLVLGLALFILVVGWLTNWR